MDATKIVRTFLTGKESFVRIAGTCRPGPVCVLDSSFNPPTLAHLALVRAAIRHFKQRGENPSVVLLLSSTNPDKPQQTVESYAHRLSMVQLFAKEISSGDQLSHDGQDQDRDEDPIIALTSHGRFADKLADIKTNLNSNDIVFLVGFDTLKRILDPKYYPDASLEQAIGPMMKAARFFCVARAFDTHSKMPQVGPVNEQLNFTKTVEMQKQHWSDRIEMFEAQSTVSSSLARATAQKHGDLLELVPESIAKYIEEHHLYEE